MVLSNGMNSYFRLAIYDGYSKSILGYTDWMTGGAYGDLLGANIKYDPAGNPITHVAMTKGHYYYLSLQGQQAGNGTFFYGKDRGTTFGLNPKLSLIKDNTSNTLVSSLGSNESQYSVYIAAYPSAVF